jgi:hypothetical protein
MLQYFVQILAVTGSQLLYCLVWFCKQDMGQSPSFSSVHQGSEASPRPVNMVISQLLFSVCDLQYFDMVT